MDIGKYIHQLLLEYDTVIIPGFGAFVSSYKPAELNDDTNELKPPSKTISFNQQIRNNDGLLVGKVAEGEVISHFDALKEIEKERENIIYQLDKGEKFLLDKTGDLFRNEQNEIELIPTEDDSLLLESFGLESVIVDEVQEKDKVIIPEKEELGTEKEHNKPDELIVPAASSAPKSDAPKKEEKKKKRAWLWILIVLIPIIIAGIYLTLNQKNKEELPVEQTKKIIPEIKEEPVEVVDTIVIDSTTTMLTDSVPMEKKEEVAVESTIDDGKPKYYLVGGSFKIQENANTYFTELKAEGFEPFHIGKRGNFFIVGIGTYDSEKEALAARSVFYEKNPNSDVWIMKE